MGVVEKGNKIFIVADQLTSNEITVEWQQNLRARKEPYYSVEFTNKDQSTYLVAHVPYVWSPKQTA